MLKQTTGPMTVVQPGSSPRQIAMGLAVSEMDMLNTSDGPSLPLRSPGDHERLIGVISADAHAAQPLFPADRLLPIALDPADPLPGPAVAWEALDAVVLDADALQRLAVSTRHTLLGAGVQFVVVADHRPDDLWPWVQTGPVWVMSWIPQGPTITLTAPEVYEPMLGFSPVMPRQLRLQIGLAGIGLFLLFVCLALLRLRWFSLAVIGTSVIATGLIFLWKSRLPAVDLLTGSIIVNAPPIVQTDRYLYVRAKVEADSQVPLHGDLHPIFTSPGSAQGHGIRIDIDSNSEASASVHLKAGQTVAWLNRSVAVQPAVQPTSAAMNSPMSDLARDGYLRPGSKVAGTTNNADQWPAVIINTIEQIQPR